MAIIEHYYTKFECDNYYHIYNRSIDLKPLFITKENYQYFLKQYDKYLGDVVETLAYNLLGNHFHLLILIKPCDIIEKFRINDERDESWDVHKVISHQFRKFFQSYSMAFNKQHERVGTLFQTPFKRVLIDNEIQLQRTINYIHQNAAKHGLVRDFKDWHWSSYYSILSEKPSKLMRENIFQIFYNSQTFEESHKQIIIGKEFDDIEF